MPIIKILPSFAYAKEGKRAHATRSVFDLRQKRFAPKPLSIYEISNFKGSSMYNHSKL